MSTSSEVESAARKTQRPIDLLREMALIRALEQKALDLSKSTPPRVLGSVHLCAGQEAVPVGTLAGLELEDQIVATYRGHGWAISSGLSLVEVLGEICHRSIGINGGRGGSAYMMAPSRRFIGENSIVGAGLPIGCGVALANAARKSPNLVAVSLGDGAFNQGSTHEGLAFAAAKGLPVIVICENNGWSELTATSSTFKIQRIAQRAGGYGVTGLTIDGSDPLVVRDTIRQVAARVRNGHGPVLVECQVPRLWGHYNRDFEHYRSKEDREAARQRDPLTVFSSRLIAEGALDETELRRILAEVQSEVETAAERVFEAPEPDPGTARSHVFSPHASTPASTTDPVETKELSFIQAVNEALSVELRARPEVLVYGEDVGVAGGIFGASKGLQERYGSDRVFDTPISEAAILGSAVGAAMLEMRPIVEIMWADFMLVALDQVVNQAANIRYVTGGTSSAPIVVRTQQGVTPGSCAQHSQSLEALVAHIPGLRVAIPSTPQDAYDVIRAALRSSDPCIVIEARGLYASMGQVELGSRIDTFGKARLVRSGKDALIVSWGTMMPAALRAADALETQKMDVGVLDLRWLCPLDEGALKAAVADAGGRVVIAHEANLTGGFGAEITARLHEWFAGTLDLRIRRVATPDVRIPASPVLQRALIPSADTIADAVRAVSSSRD